MIFRTRQKDEKFWQEIVSESEPIYTDFNGMGKLITQRRETGNPNLRAVNNRITNTEASISVFKLEKDPSDSVWHNKPEECLHRK